MYNDIGDILETISMIRDKNLDVRTTTMGISLLDCADSDIDRSCEKIYEKICRKAEHLVETGENYRKVRNSNCEQAGFRYTDCHAGRCIGRRPGEIRTHAGSSSSYCRN